MQQHIICILIILVHIFKITNSINVFPVLESQITTVIRLFSFIQSSYISARYFSNTNNYYPLVRNIQLRDQKFIIVHN